MNWYLESSPGEPEIQLARTVQKVFACRYQPVRLDVTAMAEQLQEAEVCLHHFLRHDKCTLHRLLLTTIMYMGSIIIKISNVQKMSVLSTVGLQVLCAGASGYYEKHDGCQDLWPRCLETC